MNNDVEASESSKLIITDNTEIKNVKNQKNESIKLLACFVLLSLASFIAYNFKGFKREKLASSSLNLKTDLSLGKVEMHSPTAQNFENKEGVTMMSLVGATPDSHFNACQSLYLKDDYLNVYVPPGCISLFVNDVTKAKNSFFMTYCGCETIGPKMYDFVSLQNAKLIGKDGSGLISYIATGDAASITLYNSAEYDSQDRIVIGPNNRISADQLVKGENKSGVFQTWDDAIYSIILQSWVPCDLVSFLILIIFVRFYLIFYF